MSSAHQASHPHNQSHSTVTISSAAIRQQTLEFSYRECRINSGLSTSPDRIPVEGHPFPSPVQSGRLSRSSGSGREEISSSVRHEGTQRSYIQSTPPFPPESLANRRLNSVTRTSSSSSEMASSDPGNKFTGDRIPTNQGGSAISPQTENAGHLNYDFHPDSVGHKHQSYGVHTHRAKPAAMQPSDSCVMDGVPVTESTPLVHSHGQSEPPAPSESFASNKIGAMSGNNLWTVLKQSVTCSPAVVLGVMLNLLDALSYGIIIFPTSDPRMPVTAPQAGISMFLLSTIVSQIAFAFGGSAFKGANGSMMIEVIPFFHTMVRIIEQTSSASASDESILATVMVSYAMSTILTGIAFFLLGYFRLGSLIQFFPRHILVGCIGGIGWFLFITGIEVTTGGLKPSLDWEVITKLFSPGLLVLWGGSLSLAILLKAMQRKVHHPLFVPIFYATVPLVFYFITVVCLKMSLDQLREYGLLLTLPSVDEAPFWTFWTYFNGFKDLQWSAIPPTIGTQIALAVSTNQEVDVNGEIVGHGLANLLAGLVGTPQNYLVYSNSVLFIRSGGNTTVAGFMLGMATIALWIWGSQVIGLVPTLVVGGLIFHLAIDLMKESVWDTLQVGISSWEYYTIILIILTMAVFGFTEGIIFGIILACVFFVVMYSRRPIIREIYDGNEIRSKVHRPFRQRLLLDEVGEQIRVVKLQGFIFFGVISQLESLVDSWLHDLHLPRFIILDCSLVSGVDYSAMEAFLRLKKSLIEHQIQLVFCNLGDIGADFAKFGVFDTDPMKHPANNGASLIPSLASLQTIQNFESVDDALEYCENTLLCFCYEAQTSAIMSIPSHRQIEDHISFSWRTNKILSATSKIWHDHHIPFDAKIQEEEHPVAQLLRSIEHNMGFDSLSSEEVWEICSFFTKHDVHKGDILWTAGSKAAIFYIIEKGQVCQLIIERGRRRIIEMLLPGTMVGEIELVTERSHLCTLESTEHSILWGMTRAAFEEFSKQNPTLSLKFIKISLSFDCIRFANAVSSQRH
ncbi:hypothetical protein HDU76_007278 [Blyttiomyces sp. JEL0837]|nr:hypothetical protein HDU76_007278 [Blyttiomyces sp. JEL0837]